ncbi:hypothetical protein DYB37_008919 [Aphanomyces astaci]|uniref:LNR domain-containing protein n=1 Tax=Aphanomyces astaci TaxID=112090 RepID=A0A418E9C4_APHAT|nr:hypothetical protein DYB37_008919 [Aphanomyces astaci]
MISLMHVGALVVPKLCHRKSAATSLSKPPQPPPPAVTVRRLSSKTQSRIIVRRLSKRAATDWFDHVFIVFNFIVILCQGRQVYEMLSTMVDPTKVVSYAVIVILYSVLSPCLIFINNIQTKYTLVCYVDALFSFTLSCGHPMFSVAIQGLELILINPNLVRDNRWTTETLLFARLFGITSPVDFFVKHVMHLSTYFTICRLANTSHSADSNKDQSSVLQRSQQNRVMRRLNLGVSSGLGVVCAILLGRCLLYREPCPSYCVSNMQPLVDLGCHCAYANINCHTLGIDDPTPLLDPRIIGTRLVYVQFSRCDLENGLNATSVVPFQQITKIQVIFSNMSSWTGPLPASLNNILVQYSRLETIPHALLYDIPPELSTILIDASPLKTIPDIAFNAWSFVQRLQLLNVSLTTFPNGILSMPHLTELNLRGNNITSMFPESAWPSPLTIAGLAGNGLKSVPWTAAKRGVNIDLSGNPIEDTTTLDAAELKLVHRRSVILDDTPYCNVSQDTTCKHMCGPDCFAFMVGDYFCDLACFTPACGFDKGDCDEFGFS